MAVTDLITSLFTVYFIVLGAYRGFLRSLLGPLSLIAATFISIVYYRSTKQLITSLVIGLIGPMLLHFVLRLFLGKWITQGGTARARPELLSRIGGSLLTLIWGWVFIILTLILLAALPPLGSNTQFIHKDVVGSASYGVAKPIENLFFQPPPAPKNPAAPIIADQKANIESMAEDPRFQKVLQDPEIQKEIAARDVLKLMRNPKMMALTQQIMNDPAMMKKVMSIYRSQMNQSSTVITNAAQ